MFVTNVVLGNLILDRGFFFNLKEATYHANEHFLSFIDSC